MVRGLVLGVLLAAVWAFSLRWIAHALRQSVLLFSWGTQGARSDGANGEHLQELDG